MENFFFSVVPDKVDFDYIRLFNFVHQAVFYKTSAMLVNLILTPLLAVGVAVSCILWYDPEEWLILVLSFVSIGIAIAATLYLTFRVLLATCTVQVKQEGLLVTLSKPNPLYRHSFLHPWNTLINMSVNRDSSSSKPFIQIKSTEAPHNYILTPSKAETIDPDNWELWLDMKQMADTINSDRNPKEQITFTGFYSGWWAKILAIGGILICSTGFVLKIGGFDAELSWWKLLSLSTITVLFSLSVWSTWKQEKNNQPGQNSDTSV